MLGFGKPRQPSAGSALQVEHPPKQGPLQRLRRERQRGDHAALATGAHAYLPAVQIAQAADDRQADATALRMAGMGAAMNTGNVGRGDSVAVIGCGGVGDAAVGLLFALDRRQAEHDPAREPEAVGAVLGVAHHRVGHDRAQVRQRRVAVRRRRTAASAPVFS